jgi:DNA-binding transcriptional LysR family regulator
VLTLQQFAIVDALARHRHFGRAAVSLGVSQPSLTRSLKELERRLGVPLFDRQGVQPTVFGELALKFGGPIVQNVAELKREFDLAKGLEIGRLAISAGPYPADISARKALGILSARHPMLSIAFISSNWSSTLDLILDRSVDVGFADISEAVDHPELETELVRQAPLQFFCAEHHPLAARAYLTQDDLLEFPWAGPTAPGRMRAFLPEVAKPFGTFDDISGRFHPRILVETFSDAKEIVRSGAAIGVAIPYQLRREIAAGECKLLPLQLPWLSLNYGFITRRGRTLTPAAKAFIEIARQIERELDQQVAATG